MNLGSSRRELIRDENESSVLKLPILPSPDLKVHLEGPLRGKQHTYIAQLHGNLFTDAYDERQTLVEWRAQRTRTLCRLKQRYSPPYPKREACNGPSANQQISTQMVI